MSQSDVTKELVDRIENGQLRRYLRIWNSGSIKPVEMLVAVFIDGLWQTVA